MTETCGIVSIENPYAGPRHSGSAGTLVPGVECQIVSVDKLKPLPPGQLGEIWVRGHNMMQGILIANCIVDTCAYALKLCSSQYRILCVCHLCV